MTYVTVPDKNVGDPFTEPMWDSYIKDNFNKGVVRPIADSLLTGDAATVIFSSIPADFAHLLLVTQARGTNASLNVSGRLRLNGDTGNNYDSSNVAGTGTSVAAGEGFGVSSLDVGEAPGGTATGSIFGASLTLIPDYVNATRNKTALTLVTRKAAPNTTAFRIEIVGAAWRNNSAIVSVTFFFSSGNIVTGSRFTLYGMPN